MPQYTYQLFGSGTDDDPYEVGSASDLELLATSLNNGSARYTGEKTFVLSTDLDFTDRDPFVGIDEFTGTLDGRGHTITGLVYGRGSGSNPERLGLIRALTGGVVRDLRLEDVTASSTSTTESDYASGLVVIASSSSTIEGVSVVDATVDAPGAEKAAGLVAELRTSSVTDNWVTGTVTAKKMPGGVVAYATDSSSIERNLVSVDTTTETSPAAAGTRGVNAAAVVSYPGNNNGLTVTGNVVHGGSVTQEGATAGFAGRVVGYYQTSGNYVVPTLRDNAGVTTFRLNGSAVTDAAHNNQQGADLTPEEIGQRATYEDRGWDFSEDWRMDDELGHPVPKFVTAGEIPNRVTATMYGDPQTQRGFTWYSDLTDGATVVRIGTDRALTDAVTIEATQHTSQNNETFYRAVATDLEPGERYYFQPGNSDAEAWGSVGTFETADGESDFTFVDLTDTQSQNLDEAELSASTMAKALASVPEAEFMMHNGDVVENGGREQDWSDLLDSAEASLTSTTIAPASGNHDAATDAFVNHFNLEAPNDQDTSTGAYYSFTYNDAHFAVLNTNEDSTQGVSDAQREWLREDVTAARDAGAKWIVLSMHKGAYTTADHLDDSDVINMREELVPLIDELDIDLVLQGHDHVMNRTKVLVSDPDGVAGARAVVTTVITEIKNGKRAEYAVSPEGTIYFLPNTAGAKHYDQATSAEGGIDIERYLQLFDRTGRQDDENFSAISVTDDRLTVDVYDIRDEGSPRHFESFGIDREVTPVVTQIDALPAVDELTTGDAEAVEATRVAVDALSAAQQSAVTNLDDFVAREQRLRELQGRVATDGSEVAWAAPEATSRRPVTVRNAERTALSDVPVKLSLPNTPDVARDTFAVYATDGTPLAHEVVTWNVGGTSEIWVRVPMIPGHSATTIWAYYGGEAATNDPTAVWEDYSLVEHFARSAEDGEQLLDSTGTANGVVRGAGVTSTSNDDGGSAVTFGDSRIEYGGDIGGNADRIAISALVSLTAEQVAAMTDDAPIVAKEAGDGNGRSSYWMGYSKSDGRLGTRLAGNSWEFADADISTRHDASYDGTQHLLTQTYDGMTYSVFLDGKEVHSQFLEYRTTYGDPDVLTTIGDYVADDSSSTSPFTGRVDELQIAGVKFSPDLEKFRWSNLTGGAVEYGGLNTRGADEIELALAEPASGTTVEAGLVEVTGTVSKRVELVASLGGADVLREEVDAGSFTVQVPVNLTGEQKLTLSADGATAEVTLKVEDTVAPATPTVSDTSSDDESRDVDLTVTPDSDDLEALSTQFYADEQVTLDETNTVVRSGSTTDRTPASLTPTSGQVSDEALPTTVGDDRNPYQVFTVTLTEEQAVENQHHLTWTGTGDDRRVSAWAWDTDAEQWVLKDDASNAEGDAVSLDVATKASDNAVAADRTISVLVWRGLTENPWGEGHDYTASPDPVDVDWSFDHVPDSQLYTQATPELFVDQMQYVVDVAEERKTSLVIQSGDLVNREYLSQEYQWKNAEPAMNLVEDTGLPFMISWGNHDYQTNRNARVMLQKYYPFERFEESLEGTGWTFGGSHDIDNYYYLGDIEGAKLLLLTVGYFSSDNANDEGLAWAKEVIADNPDRTVIIANHNSVNTGENRWANDNVTSQLVDPYDNVKLVLGGHISGTGVASRTTSGDNTAYGILTDYQGRVYGGQEFLRHLSVDAENGLLYSNTWSPLLETATSSYSSTVRESAVPGFHGSDSENFVIELDLGGTTTRTLATESFTLATGAPQAVGEAQTSVGDEAVAASLTGLESGTTYEWYADLTDASGHTTRSVTSAFTVSEASVEAPSAPSAVTAVATGDAVTVTWEAPSTDGGAAVEEYEVTLTDGTSSLVTTVAGDLLTASYSEVADGTWTATVRARNTAGWSPASNASEPVVVDTGDPDPSIEAPEAPARPTARVKGTTVTTTWSAPASDGGAAVEAYQARLSNGRVVSVDGEVTTATFAGLKAGTYTTTVRARNSAGWSAWSSASSAVRVTASAKASSRTKLAASVVGRTGKVRLTVRVRTAGPQARYAVQLKVDGRTKRTVRVAKASGKATVVLAVKPGRHTFRAVFAGTSQVKSSKSGTVVRTVRR